MNAVTFTDFGRGVLAIPDGNESPPASGQPVAVSSVGVVWDSTIVRSVTMNTITRKTSLLRYEQIFEVFQRKHLRYRRSIGESRWHRHCLAVHVNLRFGCRHNCGPGLCRAGTVLPANIAAKGVTGETHRKNTVCYLPLRRFGDHTFGRLEAPSLEGAEKRYVRPRFCPPEEVSHWKRRPPEACPGKTNGLKGE